MIPSMASSRTYVGPAYYDSRQPVTRLEFSSMNVAEKTGIS